MVKCIVDNVFKFFLLVFYFKSLELRNIDKDKIDDIISKGNCEEVNYGLDFVYVKKVDSFI